MTEQTSGRPWKIPTIVILKRSARATPQETPDPPPFSLPPSSLLPRIFSRRFCSFAAPAWQTEAADAKPRRRREARPCPPREATRPAGLGVRCRRSLLPGALQGRRAPSLVVRVGLQQEPAESTRARWEPSGVSSGRHYRRSMVLMKGSHEEIGQTTGRARLKIHAGPQNLLAISLAATP